MPYLTQFKEMRIEKIINQPVTSNCFIIFHEKDESCIVIDPGSEDVSVIESFIENKKVDFIFLTHEHYDHIWGADKLRQKYNAKLCCSLEASNAITNKKRNLSVFYNQVGFELNAADIIIEGENVIDWHSVPVEIIHTPGHTEGSICIKIFNNLFTGDTIIKEIRTVTKRQGGNKEKLQNSIEKLKKMGLNSLNLYCGHKK